MKRKTPPVMDARDMLEHLDQELQRMENARIKKLLKKHPLPWRPGILAYILPPHKGVELRGYYPIDANGGVIYEMMFGSGDAILAWFKNVYKRHEKEATK